MPEYFRALAVILVFAALIFAFSSKLCTAYISRDIYVRRRNTWFAITLIAFLAHNYWLYAAAAGFYLYKTSHREHNPAALFFLLLFVLPPNYKEISGFGVVNYLFELSHPRLLALVILLPVLMKLIQQKDVAKFGKFTADKLLFAYLVLVVTLYLRETSVTDTLRQAFYQFTDVFLPYYVVSRSIKDKQAIREIILCFVIAVLILALIALFEMVRYWHLYTGISEVLDIKKGNQGYSTRISFLRASGTVGPIPLGYLMVTGIGLYLYVQSFLKLTHHKRIGLFLLVAGLIAALSRAPWIGAMVLTSIFIFLGQKKITNISKIVISLVVILPLLSTVIDMQKFYDVLPYVGKEEEQKNVEYREQLLENSLIVIKRHPWFGSVNYIETPEMQALIQGQGIIDIVNTYVRVALETGFIGVGLFIGFFLSACWGVFRNLSRLRVRDGELHLLGRSLLATMVSILLIIFTVSSVSIIPVVYWSIAAMCVGFSNLASLELNRENLEEVPAFQ